MVSATAKHGPKNKLIHIVKMAGALPKDLTDYRITLQMSLDGDRDCESEFRPPPFGRNPLIRCGVGETSKFGRITKPNARTLQYTFKERVIGSPRKYGWRFHVSDCTAVCTSVDSLPDETVPDQPRYLKHRLGG